MGKGRYVVALDQGTTSSRAVLVDRAGRMVDAVQREFPQIYPHPGWVEHSPQEILLSQLGSLTELLQRNHLEGRDIDAIGIDNQRETTLVWDRDTGEPVYNAIVWQCRRTSELVERLCGDAEVAQRVQDTTGLLPDPYYSASKLAWILENVPHARERAERGELCFGTVDSYLVWVLTGGLVHATDETNASRTMLYDIRRGRWDPWLLELFGIPPQMMPEVRRSSGSFGETSYPTLPPGIPITGVAGDQQAALFGQCCFEAGQAKNTYGTGCFMLLNTGREAPRSSNRLVTTIVASPPGSEGTRYALEGSVFVGGALIQWLRDELRIISTSAESEYLARSVPDSAGVYIVPAFTGLGAPWWAPDARGAIFGLTRGAGRAHIARAALEAIAYQVADLGRAMERDAGPIEVLNVDGGASANDFLMQFEADLMGCELRRPANVETTALGAAYLAGLATGFWSSTDELRALRTDDTVFRRGRGEDEVGRLMDGWHDAVRRTIA